MNLYGWDNCPKEVKDQIKKLNEILVQHLGENLLGIYIHGSLALKSFNPISSDLDVIVLLRDKLDLETRFQLIKEMLILSKKPSPVEISFITRDAIFPWKHPTPFQLHSSEYWRQRYEERVAIDDKNFWAETPEDSDLACHLTLINKKGICIHGLPVVEAFPIVPESDFRSSILSGVDYAVSVLKTQPVYGVLTLCRVLSYLETGEILSKREAGIWALPVIPEDLKYIVSGAVEMYEGTSSEVIDIIEEDLESYSDLMKSSIDFFNQKDFV
jgi:predicted nucleotidyltransferase